MLISRRALLAGGPAVIAASSAITSAKAETASPLNFLVIGDWGKSDEPQQRAIAVSMGKTARESDCRFVISTGDNFYERGVSSTDDALWNKTYEQIYSDDSLLCPWYPVLGNHDHYGNTQAQIDYSKISSRWTMPAHYYRRTHVVGGIPLLELFFLDTTPLVDDSISDWIENAMAWKSGDQYSWLEASLKASRAKWKIVVGHHPVHSGGPHEISQALVQRLRPLLVANDVIAYLNGHDHNFQHIVADRMHFLTCGSGSQSKQAQAVEGTRFASPEMGFMRCEITQAQIVIAFLAADGRTLHTAELASET